MEFSSGPQPEDREIAEEMWQEFRQVLRASNQRRVCPEGSLSSGVAAGFLPRERSRQGKEGIGLQDRVGINPWTFEAAKPYRCSSSGGVGFLDRGTGAGWWI
eukprot:10082454-Lingulodinium_polyedra.AAC.1